MIAINGEQMAKPSNLQERRIEWVPLGDVQSAPSNPKEHDIGEICVSIGRRGFVELPAIDERTGRLVAGHGRIEALIKMQADKAPLPGGLKAEGGKWLVPVVRGWASKNDADAAAYLVASNRLVELGGWNDEMLARLMAEIAAVAPAEIEGSGFDQQDVDKFINEMNSVGRDVDAEPQIDRADDLRKQWKTETGQLWALGDHRLLCGDSTKQEDVARVMGTERADVCLTDPPYGLGDGSTDKNSYATYSDTLENLRVLIGGAIIPLIGQMRVVFTPGNMNQYEYPKPSWTMAWFCPAGTGCGPWGFCCWQPIMCYGKDVKLANGQGSHPDAIVHTEGASSDAHPCAKPMKLWLWLMERVSLPRDIIYEPFSGSGTTLMASEQLGRVCRAIELNPGYVAVALQRYKDATGKTPLLVNEAVKHA